MLWIIQSLTTFCTNFLIHLPLGLGIFLGLAKIRRSQIRSTEVITNQKDTSEGIPSLTYFCSEILISYFLKIHASENRTTEIRRSQEPSVFWILNLRFKYWMASMPQFVSWILPANSNDNTFCEVAGGMCINFQGAKNSIYASWNWSKKWHSIRTWNPSIYNIIRWVAWTMGQMNRRPSVWCPSIIFFSWFLAKFFAKILSIYFLIFL